MDTMYSLEPNYPWPKLPLLVMALLLFAIVWMLIKINKKPKTVEEKKTLTADDQKKSLIQKYSSQIKRVQKDRTAGKIDERECYGQLSLCVRDFVSEMTGVNVKSYTYEDIKTLNNPKLTELIGDFYGPEFGVEKLNDEAMMRNLQSAIDKTLKLIKYWK